MIPQGIPQTPSRMALAEIADSMGEDDSKLENPFSKMDTGSSELMIEKGFFPGDIKTGDKVTISATVGKVGSKVSVTPSDITKTEGQAPGTEAPAPREGEETGDMNAQGPNL